MIGQPLRRALTFIALVGALVVPMNAAAAGGPQCMGLAATIVGTDGDDIIVGTDGDDVIVGKAGNDVIRGRGGNDVICGGAGDDVIYGGSGDDRIAGGSGDDTIFGGTGNDLIMGKGGNDTAAGGSGVDDCRAENATECEFMALGPGDRGAAVRALQTLLKEQTFYRGPVDGVYGSSTGSAVVAFHKVLERKRTDRFLKSDWRRLLAFDPQPPIARSGERNRIEIDITHQVLYLIEKNKVAAIVPVSTGGGHLYYSKHQGKWRYAETPRGDFAFYWRQVGWNTDQTTGWSVYNYWGFSPYYGVHGYLTVPTYPASHGCVRLHIWDSDQLVKSFFIGMPVHIWDG